MLKLTNDTQENELLDTLDSFTTVIKDDPILVFSFLLNLQHNPVKVSQNNVNLIKQKINSLNETLSQRLIHFPMYKLLKPIEFEEAEPVIPSKFDLYKTIQECIYDVLIKYSSKEIENVVNSYFNPKKRYSLKIKNLDDFLYKIFEITNKEKQKICIEYFVYTLEDSEAKKMLEFFIKRIEKVNALRKKDIKDINHIEEQNGQNIEDFNDIKADDNIVVQNNTLQTNEDDFDKTKTYVTHNENEKLNEDLSLFFTILYLKNINMYKKCTDIIFNESYFTRLQIIKILPSYDLQYKDGFLSEDLVRYVLEYKPVERMQLIKYLFENKKKLLIKLIKDLYYIFDTSKLNLHNTYLSNCIINQDQSTNTANLYQNTVEVNDNYLSNQQYNNLSSQHQNNIIPIQNDYNLSDQPYNNLSSQHQNNIIPIQNDYNLSDQPYNNLSSQQNNNAHNQQLISSYTFDFTTLTLEEHVDICSSVDEHIFYYFENLHYLQNMQTFINLLVKKEDEFVIQFFTKYLQSQNMFYEKVVTNYLKTKKLTEKLQNYFVLTFIDNINVVEIADEQNTDNDNKLESIIVQQNEAIKNIEVNNLHTTNKIYLQASFIKEIFFILSQHLSQTQIISKLEKYCIDDITLVEFLKVLSPEDLYVNVHYFKDNKKSLRITQLISQKRVIFNSDVCKFVIQELEKKELPVLFMRTVIISMMNFNELREFVISLMFRLVKIEIWNNKELYNGFVKCLSYLGDSAFDIVMCMPETQMRYILQDEKMLIASEKYVKKSVLKGKYAFLFKNTVYSQLKKMKK